MSSKTNGCASQLGKFLAVVILIVSGITLVYLYNPLGLGRYIGPEPAPFVQYMQGQASHTPGQTHPQVQAVLLPVTPYSIVGKPGLTPTFINQVLARAGSPAKGTGQALYDLSKQYHINDAYALAVFKHESLFGRAGMAQVTLSLGNIRCSVGYRCINGYRAYASWVTGYADWYHLMATVYVAHGLTTIPQIIPVYAPASDGNNVSGYIADVEQSVTQWQKGKQ
jgi:hypothetical protein